MIHASLMTRLPQVRSAFLLLPLLFLPQPYAKAQEANAGSCSDTRPRATIELAGVITDSTGSAIPGAIVKGHCGSFTGETKTNSSGEYRLMTPTGRLTVEVAAERFSMLTRQVAVAAQPATQSLNIPLAVASVTSSVDVIAEAPYLEDRSSSGSKVSLNLLEVPQAITVVSRRLMDEQGAVKLDDVLKNVAGVSAGGYYDGWDYYRIRGFDASINNYLDGLYGGNGTADETWGLESVDVLKGPSSSLYGQSVLGGLINLRSKRPQPSGFMNLQFTAGSFGYLMPAVDLGGSLNRGRTIYGRLVVLHRHQDSFVDYAWNHRTYIAPSLTWRIGEGTTVTGLGRFQMENGRHAFPLPAQGTVLPNRNGNIPISRYVGELTDDTNKLHEDNRHLGHQFEHRFNESLTFRQNFRYAHYRQDWKKLLYPSYLDEDERTLYRYPLDYRQDWKNYAIDSGLDAVFRTGSLRHNLLAGYDYFRKPSTSPVRQSISTIPRSTCPSMSLIRSMGRRSFPRLWFPLTTGDPLRSFRARISRTTS